ncbi:hypothetical protein DJ568_01950 [Mucilaginibacter hurinus]|uniref:Glycosyltransferase subfamily 4-like N-terminal domain-containing protein n=1 Tax=Mucilaginibacter hurinus TaxID=2201324 RepID=A0A367GTB5_9SPHI|nr:glycosyltransferase [Mucilaginibacter hurinus]RCH56647.1 hypothetical protein DJ568_01950 [Mucilaginibacter hurinus]
MKISYAVWAQIPSKAAHSLHFMKQCQGLAANGADVVFIFPANDTNIEMSDCEIFDYYNVKPCFRLKRVAVKKLPAKKLFYSIELANYVKRRSGLFFTRDPDLASVSVFYRLRTMLELHATLDSSLMRAKHVWKYLRKLLLKSEYLVQIIVISEALKKILVKEGIKSNIISVLHDASDIPIAVDPVIFNDAGRYTGEIGYIGHLYQGKGIEIILKIAPMLPTVRFHIVGGLDADISYWNGRAQNENIQNIVFHGFVNQRAISAYIVAFDICLLPNQRSIKVYGNSKANISDITSPLKMFDYMAHGKAIISSDLPVLKEVLNDSNAIFCNPDNPRQWSDAIEYLLQNNQRRIEIGRNAYLDFERYYTWKKRGSQIIKQIK